MSTRDRLLAVEKTAEAALQQAFSPNVISGGTFTNPTIINPTVTGGNFTNPNITNPNITGGTQLNPSITTPTVTNGALIDPTVEGTTTFEPIDPTPLTTAQVLTKVFTGQTTAGSHLGVVLASFALPGTAPAPAATGVLELDVEITMKSTTTTDAARFKLTWQWSVNVPGAPIALGTLTTSLSVGSNAGAPPAGWTATLALDGGSTHAQVKVDGDAALTVHCKVLAQWGYST